MYYINTKMKNVHIIIISVITIDLTVCGGSNGFIVLYINNTGD